LHKTIRNLKKISKNTKQLKIFKRMTFYPMRFLSSSRRTNQEEAEFIRTSTAPEWGRD
jgi:hypothetical protein